MSIKLLAVDDDQSMHKMLGFTFKNEDLELVSKFNGEEAKQFIQQDSDSINAVILDWEMPGMNGLDLLKWIKKEERHKDIPVIMLTSHSDKNDIQKGIDAGAYYYITKPYNKELLKSFVSRAVHDYEQVRSLKKHLHESQNPFRNMSSGIFKIRTLEEAQRLSVLIANASAMPEKSLLICELLINAIEHGNLGIGYEEKTQFIEQNNLEHEIRVRLNAPENKNKFATIELHRENGALKVHVQDEGNGFDYTRYLNFDETRVFDSHGRGIAMANSMLNIRYLGKGNEVEVFIPLSHSAN
ncbi:MAG: response regulator [Chitinophagales bacterium]|nr:response regulator [Chitinophagales bacterium]